MRVSQGQSIDEKWYKKADNKWKWFNLDEGEWST